MRPKSLDYETMDRLILDTWDEPGAITRISHEIGCNISMVSRRKKLLAGRKGLKGRNYTRVMGSEFRPSHFNYRKAVERDLARLKEKVAPGMEMGEFRARLNSPEGQRFLRRVQG